MTAVLIALAAVFAELSLLAFGGGNSVLPEMERQVVAVHHWMSPRDFSALFALAQAAPGPNLMMVPLVGWRVAGWAGMLAAAAAMFAPSAIVTGLVLGVWRRFRNRPWRRIVQAGLVPVTVGLVAASAALIAETSDRTVFLVAITAVVAVVAVKTRLHPLWLLAGGALLGLSGIGQP
jgi:chromate transporter